MPATQTRTSLKRDLAIEAIASGAAGSIAEAGRIAGYGRRQSVHAALTAPDAARMLERAIEKRRDRSQDMLSRFERTLTKAARAIDALSEDRLEADPILAGNLVKMLCEARRTEHEIRDKYGIRADAERIAEGRAMYAERMKRWARIVLRAAARWNADAEAHLERLSRIALRVVPEHARM